MSSAKRSIENFTSSQVTSAPFENFTPGRRAKVQVFESSETVQLSAMPGWGIGASRVSTRVSKIWTIMKIDPLSLAPIGLRVSGSESRAKTSEPPFTGVSCAIAAPAMRPEAESTGMTNSSHLDIRFSHKER